MGFKLLVSLPPGLRGEPFTHQATNSLQNRLIRSWIESGFDPISINTPAELAAHPTHAGELAKAGVALLEVPSSGHGYPPHLPNLREALAIAVNHYPHEVLALTNADIYIRLTAKQQQHLADIGSDDFFQAHRSDIPDTHYFDSGLSTHSFDHDFSPFLQGVDFLAARAETFRQALPSLSPDLTIGLPWWDLLLPLALFNAGAFRQFMHHGSFLHLAHVDRWDKKWFLQIGIHAPHHLSTHIKRYRSPGVAYIWKLAYQQATSVIQPPKVLKWRLRLWYQMARQGIYHYPVSIPEVNRITEIMVCRQGADLDRRWLTQLYAGPF